MSRIHFCVGIISQEDFLDGEGDTKPDIQVGWDVTTSIHLQYKHFKLLRAVLLTPSLCSMSDNDISEDPASEVSLVFDILVLSLPPPSVQPACFGGSSDFCLH